MEQISWCHGCQMERPLTSDRCLHCGSWNTVVTKKGSMGWTLGFLDKRSALLLLGLMVCVGVIAAMVCI